MKKEDRKSFQVSELRELTDKEILASLNGIYSLFYCWDDKDKIAYMHRIRGWINGRVISCNLYEGTEIRFEHAGIPKIMEGQVLGNKLYNPRKEEFNTKIIYECKYCDITHESLQLLEEHLKICEVKAKQKCCNKCINFSIGMSEGLSIAYCAKDKMSKDIFLVTDEIFEDQSNCDEYRGRID